MTASKRKNKKNVPSRKLASGERACKTQRNLEEARHVLKQIVDLANRLTDLWPGDSQALLCRPCTQVQRNRCCCPISAFSDWSSDDGSMPSSSPWLPKSPGGSSNESSDESLWSSEEEYRAYRCTGDCNPETCGDRDEDKYSINHAAMMEEDQGTSHVGFGIKETISSARETNMGSTDTFASGDEADVSTLESDGDERDS